MENSISQDAGSGLSDYMLQKRIELIISINNKKVANEMENIRSTLSRLNDEIHQIRKGLDNNIVRPREEPSAGFTNAENTKSDFGRAKNTEAPKPRFGDYKPKDVAIGKFFYFGNKAVN